VTVSLEAALLQQVCLPEGMLKHLLTLGAVKSPAAAALLK